MIQELISEMTPHIVNNKKLYDENEVRRVLAKAITKTSYPSYNSDPKEAPLNQYSEATC